MESKPGRVVDLRHHRTIRGYQMSLQHTESFMAYRLTSGDDVFNPENVATINAAAAALRRGGYDLSLIHI